MKRFMLTAMHSNAGKTVMTCALLAAIMHRGIAVRSFKCGPDYIDPMFHSHVLGVPARNLDLFLQGEAGVCNTLFHGRENGELAVLEGAMGFYDGMAGTTENSAWEVAGKTGTPVILVARPRGAGLSLAAQIRGMMYFRADSGIRGILLADCRPSQAEYLRPILERETGLPVFGYLPPMKEAEWGSRRLGLLTAAEVSDLSECIQKLAEQAERTIHLDAILKLSGDAVDPAAVRKRSRSPIEPHERRETERCRIAVARDRAFCFCYEDSLAALRRAGAEPVFFSPLEDRSLPDDTDGLYLCGGYPEVYAEKLSRNRNMTVSIRERIEGGLPVIAECGGFLYLQKDLEDEKGNSWPVCGVLPGSGFRTDRLQRFGYQWILAEENSMLFRRGERVPAHEFHYWDCTENGNDLLSVKTDGRRWTCGYADDRMYAAFPHLHLGGELPLAERFVKTCVTFGRKARLGLAFSQTERA